MTWRHLRSVDFGISTASFFRLRHTDVDIPPMLYCIFYPMSFLYWLFGSVLWNSSYHKMNGSTNERIESSAVLRVPGDRSSFLGPARRQLRVRPPNLLIPAIHSLITYSHLIIPCNQCSPACAALDNNAPESYTASLRAPMVNGGSSSTTPEAEFPITTTRSQMKPSGNVHQMLLSSHLLSFRYVLHPGS